MHESFLIQFFHGEAVLVKQDFFSTIIDTYGHTYKFGIDVSLYNDDTILEAGEISIAELWEEKGLLVSS
jgi:hypothetical protein